MKRRHKIGIGIIICAAFLVFLAVTFSQSLTPYVGFKQSMELDGSAQVKGVLVSSVTAAQQGYGITFDLQDDEGTVATVVYPGIKPENIEHADSIVVIGSYESQEFLAEKILVKCPSKYQVKES